MPSWELFEGQDADYREEVPAHRRTEDLRRGQASDLRLGPAGSTSRSASTSFRRLGQGRQGASRTSGISGGPRSRRARARARRRARFSAPSANVLPVPCGCKAARCWRSSVAPIAFRPIGAPCVLCPRLLFARARNGATFTEEALTAWRVKGRVSRPVEQVSAPPSGSLIDVLRATSTICPGRSRPAYEARDLRRRDRRRAAALLPGPASRALRRLSAGNFPAIDGFDFRQLACASFVSGHCPGTVPRSHVSF